MPEPIDLSQYSSKPKDTPVPASMEVRTALVLFQKTDGTWEATPDLAAATVLAPQVLPEDNSLIAGLSVLLSDLQAQKSANLTIALTQQLAQAQMQAMANQQIASRLDLKR